MYLRIAIGAVAWIAVLVLFAAGLQRSGSPRLVSPPTYSSALARSLNQPQADAGRWWSWRVTRATSAHQMMIVDVETDRIGDATAIAAQVVGPVQAHGYREILVYVRRPGTALPARRVQWTPARGFTELVMDD